MQQQRRGMPHGAHKLIMAATLVRLLLVDIVLDARQCILPQST